jgi:hypothetical protein
LIDPGIKDDDRPERGSIEDIRRRRQKNVLKIYRTGSINIDNLNNVKDCYLAIKAIYEDLIKAKVVNASQIPIIHVGTAPMRADSHIQVESSNLNNLPFGNSNSGDIVAGSLVNVECPTLDVPQFNQPVLFNLNQAQHMSQLSMFQLSRHTNL